MTDYEYKFWDTAIKSAVFLVTIISINIGIEQFSESLEKEYKKPFWEEQLKLCQKAVKVTSLLARSERNGKVDQDKLDALFDIYYGEAPLLMNNETMKLLGEMGRRAYLCNNDVYKNKRTENECTGPIFNGHSLDFSESCRDMVIKSSNLPIDVLGSNLLRPEM